MSMFFGNRRPRGFHYTYRFSSGRGDVIRRLQRGELPSDIAADSEREYRRQTTEGLHSAAFLPTGCLPCLLLALLLVAVILAFLLL